MDDIDILNKMLNENTKITLINKYGKNKVILTEPKHPNSKITIRSLPERVIVIKADYFKSPDSVFNCSRGECKRADFIIIANWNTNKIILIIEMKTTKGRENLIIQQLIGAKCFIIYCREIGQAFWKKKDFLDGYEYRYVSLKHCSISKKKTRNDQSIIPDSPKKMLKISYSNNIDFKELARANKKKSNKSSRNKQLK